jgi:hypothetical protein
MFLRSKLFQSLTGIALLAGSTGILSAQMGGMMSDSGKKLPSPPANVSVALGSANIKINYNSPSIRGRKIMGGLVPYGQVWRTGANPATTLITSEDLKFGTLTVPAGTHTIYTLPGESQWLLIINNQTGQWGTEYDQSKDLGRTPMTAKPMSAPQELMSISFENTTATSTELHVRWEKTDEYVKITK